MCAWFFKRLSCLLCNVKRDSFVFANNSICLDQWTCIPGRLYPTSGMALLLGQKLDLFQAKWGLHKILSNVPDKLGRRKWDIKWGHGKLFLGWTAKHRCCAKTLPRCDPSFQWNETACPTAVLSCQPTNWTTSWLSQGEETQVLSMLLMAGLFP